MSTIFFGFIYPFIKIFSLLLCGLFSYYISKFTIQLFFKHGQTFTNAVIKNLRNRIYLEISECQYHLTYMQKLSTFLCEIILQVANCFCEDI